MFIPCPQYPAAILAQRLTNRIQFHRRKDVIACQRDGLHPMRAGFAFLLHMNRRRFMAVEADKEQPVSAGYSAYRWYGMIMGETPTENKPPHIAIATLAWKVGAGATGSKKCAFAHRLVAGSYKIKTSRPSSWGGSRL